MPGLDYLVYLLHRPIRFPAGKVGHEIASLQDQEYSITQCSLYLKLRAANRPYDLVESWSGVILTVRLISLPGLNRLKSRMKQVGNILRIRLGVAL